MKSIIVRTILFFVLLSPVKVSYSQSTLTLKKGVVIDSLAVPSSEGVYSIYLPKSFDLNKGWPILFGFDSTGSMSSLTQLFSKSAEEFGYIVVVSNYGEKLSVDDKSTYVELFIKHIVSLFPVQNKRMYVFGVGKDAPLNTSLPLLYKQFYGVLAIGDGYDYKLKLNRNRNFSYIGMVGDQNFKYQNFVNTHKYFKKKGIASEVYVYQGNEGLPSEKIIAKALPYFTLDAMIKGNIPKDSVWIENEYQKELKEVELLKKDGKYLLAYDQLEKMRDKYDRFLGDEELKNAQKGIRKIKSFKKQKRLRTKYKNQEIYLRQFYVLALDEDIVLSAYDNLGWWQYRIQELDKLKKENNKYAGDLVVRIRGFLKYILSEYKKELSRDPKLIDKMILLNILSTIVDKHDFDAYRKIISLSVLDGDNGTALFYLEKMLQNGFKDLEALYTIEGTLPLRISKEYNEIIKKHLGRSKYFSLD
ncbi:hypothetical protein [Aquimarina sp. SS2-1]|uniref:hypothetical protein n=1 Tax=Aquimarina besae TaxID=3342247 RepID=UPI003671FC7C